MEAAAAAAQGSLDLGSGPLWRAVYFDLGPDRPGRLLIVVHHLAVDGISWRPLLEDLDTAYGQLRAGRLVQLPAKTTPYKAWAERLQQLAGAESLRKELSYWKAVTEPQQATEAAKPIASLGPADGTEGSAATLKVSLGADETQALLQQVPAAYNTHINDVLLTALARAWERWSGSRVLFANLEGHGREDLFDDVDLSRTVGWFTSIYPVRLEVPGAGVDWQPGEALKSVKEQLRRIPNRGIGYGILRYLTADSGLTGGVEAPILFNYLGQFDRVTAASKLFRFASESTGPWHSPRQHRRHALEVNSQVMDGRLELLWTHGPGPQLEAAIRRLADEFQTALRELIAHCVSPLAWGRTPSDFPLAHLDQAALDRLTAGCRDVEDIYPLSPIQTLFHSASPGATLALFDQWHCTLRGELHVPAFQRAWQETLRRHTVLRSTIHGEGLHEPVQIVHRDAQPRWTVEDWRRTPPAEQAQRWSAFLSQDRAQPLTLTEAPVMRFALVRLAADTWKFLWSVPALLLDGWSWPLVFRDASRLYEAYADRRPAELEPVRPYRDYLEWLGRQSPGEAQSFWRHTLAGFREPTSWPGEPPEPDGTGDRYVEHPVELWPETASALQATARRMQLTLNTLVQGAWALLLHRQSGVADVVFGAAFAGRPADLPAAESIVGPFVNNLPVRLVVASDAPAADLFRKLHAQLLDVQSFQFTPLMDIQRLSEVPWRYRLFDSLIVFQNYLVDESARCFGGGIDLMDFAGPVHTNYPVLLMAEPGRTLRLTLVYDRQSVARATIERWGRDLATLLGQLPASLDKSVAELQAALSPPAGPLARIRRRLHALSQNVVPAQTEMERVIARVWQDMFGLEAMSIEENLFDLGGHSLLLVQMHNRLRETLNIDFPIVTLFEYPTVRSLAQHLGQPVAAAPSDAEQWRDRAQRQKHALAKARINRENMGRA
jgi:non-ribosomal peptide synthase protein (TIGR01720 family)